MNEKDRLSIWMAIDKLAKMHNISVSRLAVNSGLSPGTFNKSKRISKTGKVRIPSTDTISKILNYSKLSWNSFWILARIY